MKDQVIKALAAAITETKDPTELATTVVNSLEKSGREAELKDIHQALIDGLRKAGVK